MNCGGITINGINTFADFGAMISSRNTGTPTKRNATVSVPFMSGFYDFSAIYGAVAFEDREIEYTFDLIGSRSEVQASKTLLLDWLSNAHDVDIYDTDMIGWHFHGSFESAEWDEDDSGEKGSLTVTFICQPFIESDEFTMFQLEEGSNKVFNRGKPVNPMVSGTGSITINNTVQSVSENEITLSTQLMPGENTITVTGGPLILRYRELMA